jgi:hypothetical protein
MTFDPNQPRNKDGEWVVAAANKYASGKIYTGNMHFIAHEKAIAAGEIENKHHMAMTPRERRKKEIIEGFVTSSGRFVDRTEAATLAKISGQRTDRRKWLAAEATLGLVKPNVGRSREEQLKVHSDFPHLFKPHEQRKNLQNIDDHERMKKIIEGHRKKLGIG